MKKRLFYLIAISLGLWGCSDEIKSPTGDEGDGETVAVDTADYSDWSDESHGKDADPDYATVFKQDAVMRLDIAMDAGVWEQMQSDLQANMSPSHGPGQRPGQADVDFDPIWVPCKVSYNGKSWNHVGIRYKGNSSLQSVYQSRNSKYSFKLDFDQFEEEYPRTKDQRFYGFKQLNLNNNYNDASLMREKVASDLFRSFGIPAAKSAFCTVYIHRGDVVTYFGVYALVEEVDNTVIKTQYEKGGNLYKPDGNAASFASGSYNEEQFYLKTNTKSADYSDVRALYDVLNSTERTSNVAAWRASLEQVLDVNLFLKWLAANTVIQNWDTYGNMTHNYFLYHNPTTNLLCWIPWDNNEAFRSDKHPSPLSFAMTEVSSQWPLIKYILAQDDYKQRYEDDLLQFVNEVYVPATLSGVYETYYNLIKEYAYAEQSGYSFLTSPSSFDAAVTTLKNHVTTRNSAVHSYLNR